MIEIFINNQKADFFGSLTIKKDNPLFSNFDVEPTEHTYTLTLPTTATNAKIFSLIQHTLATPQKLPARIEIDGVVVLEGSCNVQSWSDSVYSVYFNGIAPYEDTNISPIKKMLSDTRQMSEVFANLDEWYNIMFSNTGIMLHAPNLITGDDADIAIVRYNAFRIYYRPSSSSVVLNDFSYNTYGVAFSIGYMLYLISEKYGFKIKGEISDLAECYTITNTTPIGNMMYSQYVASLLPKMTIKDYLIGVGAMIGCKINVNYLTNEIEYISLTDILQKQPKQISISQYSLDFGKINDIVSDVKFKVIPPLEEKQKTTIDGEEVETTIEFPATEELSKSINADGNKGYVIPFAIPITYKGAIALSWDYFDDGDPTYLKGEQWGYTSICGIASNLIIGNAKSWFVPAPQSVIDAQEFHGEFKLLNNVASRKMKLKLTSQLNPIQFTILDMWRPIYIDNIGSVFIKSINFKSDGESEIECYLY